MTKIIISLISFFILSVSQMNAGSLYNITFEEDEYTLGSSPYTQSMQSSQINLYPVSVNTQSSDSPKVVTDGRFGATTNQAVGFLKGSTAENRYIRLQFDENDMPSHGNIVIRWSVIIDQIDIGAAGDELYLQLRKSGGSKVACIKLYLNDTYEIAMINDQHPTTKTKILSTEYEIDTLLRFEWRLNLDRTGGGQELYMDSGNGYSRIGTYDLQLEDFTLADLYIYSIQGEQSEFTIDDISVDYAPNSKKYEIPFDNDLPGFAPTTSLVDPGYVREFLHSITNPNETIKVESCFTSSETSETLGNDTIDGDHVLVFDSTELSSNRIISCSQLFDPAKDSEFIVRWSMLVDSLRTDVTDNKIQCQIRRDTTSGSSNGILGYLNIYLNSNKSISISGPNTSTVTVSDVITPAYVQHIEWRIQSNGSTVTQSVWISNNGEDYTKIADGVISDLATITSFYLYSMGSKQAGFAMDNIEIVVIPKARTYFEYISVDSLIDHYHSMVDLAADLGYNTFMFGGNNFYEPLPLPEGDMGNTAGASRKNLEGLINHIRRRGMEPIMKVATINKVGKALANTELYSNHSGLLTSSSTNALNLGYVSNGNTVYDILLTPMLDELLKTFGAKKPRYFHIGLDELNIAEMSVYADAVNKTTAELYAEGINSVANILLNKNITPVMWGDTFLSTRLKETGHGVDGFTYDSRFEIANSYNADSTADSVLTAINDVVNRDKIIIADWHYLVAKDGEFPSFDYFQTLGFKDIWGASWVRETPIKQLSDYAASKDIGGMIATSWAMDSNVNKILYHLFPGLIHNSIAFFNDPAISSIGQDIELKIDNVSLNDTGTVLLDTSKKSGSSSIVIQLPAGVSPVNHKLYARPRWIDENHSEQLLTTTYNSSTQQITASVDWSVVYQDYQTFYDFRLESEFFGSDYYLCKPWVNAVAIPYVAGDAPTVAGSTSSSALMEFDFTNLAVADLAKPSIKSVGSQPALMRRINSVTLSEGGYLDIEQFSKAQIVLPQDLVDTIHDSGIHVRFKLKIDGSYYNDSNNIPSGLHSSIFSYGGYNQGFRVLLDHQYNRIKLQVSGVRDGVRLSSFISGTVSYGSWMTVDLEIKQASGSNSGEVWISLSNDSSGAVSIDYPMLTTISPLGIE